MPDKELIFQLGELTNAVRNLNKNTEGNTAEIKTLNKYMHENMGATAEKEKAYIRMQKSHKQLKYGTIGSLLIGTTAFIKAVWMGLHS